MVEENAKLWRPLCGEKSITRRSMDSHMDGWGRVTFTSQLWHSQKVLCLIWFPNDKIFCMKCFCAMLTLLLYFCIIILRNSKFHFSHFCFIPKNIHREIFCRQILKGVVKKKNFEKKVRWWIICLWIVEFIRLKIVKCISSIAKCLINVKVWFSKETFAFMVLDTFGLPKIPK